MSTEGLAGQSLEDALLTRGVPDWLISTGLLSPSLSSNGGGGSPAGLSRMAAAKRCERFYALRYLGRGSGLPIVGQRAREVGVGGGVGGGEGEARVYLSTGNEPEARFFGSLLHGVLAYYEASKLPVSMQPAWYHEQTAQAWLEQTAGERQDLVPYVIHSFQQYYQWWSDDQEPTVGVEMTYIAPMSVIYPSAKKIHRDLAYSVALDRLVVATPGKSLDIIDYKTKNRGSWKNPDALSSWSPQVEAEFRIQAMAYTIVARNLGLPIRAFRIRRVKRGIFDSDDNVMRMPSHIYSMMPRIIYSYVVRAAEIHQKLVDGEEALPDYSSCWDRYGLCDYGAICLAHTEEEAYERLRSYVMRKPKLTLPKAGAAGQEVPT